MAELGLVSNLTFEEMLKLYDIKHPLTLESLKIAKKKLLLLHPDKNKIDTTKNFIFFRNIYENLLKIYSYIHHETNEDVFKKEIEIDTSFKTFIEKNNINPVKNKEKYLKHFNEMFENIYLKNDEEEYGHDEWLKSQKEMYDMNDLEGSRKKLINQNSLIKIEIEGINFKFDKFSDVKEAHTNSIIGLDQEKLFKEKPKFNSIDEYQKYRELNKGVAMSESDALKKINNDENIQKMKAIEQSYSYMKKEEIMNKKKNEYISKFLLLS